MRTFATKQNQSQQPASSNLAQVNTTTRGLRLSLERPLDPDTRTFMELGLSHDFSRLRMYPENRPNDSDEIEADLAAERAVTQDKTTARTKESSPNNCPRLGQGGSYTTRTGVYECIRFRVPRANGTVELSGTVSLRNATGTREIAVEVTAPNLFFVPTEHGPSNQPIAHTYSQLPSGQYIVGFRMQRTSDRDRAIMQVTGQVTTR